MKYLISSTILYFASLVLAGCSRDNLLNIALEKRYLDKRLGLSQQPLAYADTVPPPRLSRRADSPPRRQSPQRQQQPNRIVRTNAQSSVHGPGIISVGHNPTSGFLENVERQSIPHGRHHTLRTSHATGSFASAQPQGPPSPNAARQAPAEHPGKTSSQGQRAVGIVTAPPGGRGYMKLERPGHVETHEVAGGQFIMDATEGHHPGDARAEASVTRGGHAYTAGHTNPREA